MKENTIHYMKEQMKRISSRDQSLKYNIDRAKNCIMKGDSVLNVEM